MLPGSGSRRIVPWRLSIGGRRADGSPYHQEHFSITRLVKGDRYEIHPELQALLGKEPKSVPCLFPEDTADAGVYTALAMFTRRMRVCWCDRFELKPEDLCREQGLMWPPEGEPGREYWWGEYSRRKIVEENGSVRVVDVEHGCCDPHTCQLAAGDYDALRTVLGTVPDRMVGKRVCGPQVEVILFLPWAKGFNPWARFCSGAWSTGRELPRSLNEIQAAAGGAPLYLIPLQLTVARAPMNTPSGRYALPVVTFAPHHVAWGQLPAAVGERMALLKANAELADALRQRMLMARQIRTEAIESPEAQAEFAAEFRPETSETLKQLQAAKAEAESHFGTLPLEEG